MQRCSLRDSYRDTANHSGHESTVTVAVVADLTVVNEIDVVDYAPTSSRFFEFSVLRLDPTIEDVNIHTCAGLGVAVIVGSVGWKVVLVDTIDAPRRRVRLSSREFDFGILFHICDLWIAAQRERRRFSHLNRESLDCSFVDMLGGPGIVESKLAG